MRLYHLVNEWRIKQGYAGRGLIKSLKSQNVILFIYMTHPEKVGLLWMIPDGTIYLNNKKIGKTESFNPEEIKSTTHKKLIADVYNKIGLNKYPGNLRDNVENFYEKNIRGRIINDEIWFYESETSGTGLSQRDYEKLGDEATREIMKYIPEQWWTKKLSEGKTTEDIFGEITEILQKECSEILRLYSKKRGMMFIRNTKQIIINYETFIPRTDRRPLDMDIGAHRLYDKLFKEKFGWPARSEGVFVSSISHERYGYPNYFFPFDGYKYVWSPNFYDLYAHTPEWSTDYWIPKYKSNVEKYTDNNLEQALQEGQEVAFKCKKYILVKYSFEIMLKEWLRSI